MPFFSVFGSQSHHSFLGIESMTDGTCMPQPNQVRLPIKVVSKEAGTVFDTVDTRRAETRDAAGGGAGKSYCSYRTQRLYT